MTDGCKEAERDRLRRAGRGPDGTVAGGATADAQGGQRADRRGLLSLRGRGAARRRSGPHIQHEEDECFYVLEGRFEFLIEGAKTEAVTGSLVYVPKGTLHAFENAGEATGKLLITQTPGGLHERLIEELGHAAEGQSAGDRGSPRGSPR